MMIAAFFLGLAAVVVGVYWLVGLDMERAPTFARKRAKSKHKGRP